MVQDKEEVDPGDPVMADYYTTQLFFANHSQASTPCTICNPPPPPYSPYTVSSADRCTCAPVALLVAVHTYIPASEVVKELILRFCLPVYNTP